MTTRTRTAAAAMVVVGAIAGATAIPALTGAQTNGAREITVRMKVRDGTEIHHAKRPKGDKPAPGDAVIIRLKMFSPTGTAIGSAYTECVKVGRAGGLRAPLQCMQTYNFRDGQIVTAGVVRFSDLESISIPIVGGSGAYRGASGQLTAGEPVKGFASVDVLHLDG